MVVIEAENNISSLRTKLLVDYVFTDQVSSLSLSDITSDFDLIIREIVESKEFTAKEGSMSVIHNTAGSNIKRVLLLGMGDRKNLESEKTRNLTGKVVNKSKELATDEFVIVPFKDIDKEEMESYGFGGILAVGRGSSSSPKLIVIEYSGSTKNDKPIVVVGKAVT